MMNQAINGGRGRALLLLRRAPEVSKGPVGSCHNGTTFIRVEITRESSSSSVLANQIAHLTDERQGCEEKEPNQSEEL